jgi:HK97 gp10 family phage protein
VRISHTIKGLTSLDKKLQKFQKECLSGQVKAMQDAVFLIHGTAVELIQDNASGTPQVRYTNGRARNVLASKPGDAPNTDTGRLVQSIKFDFQDGGLKGRVGSNLKYAAWLEFGTKDMEPRPWLSTAVSMTAKNIGEIFAKAVRNSINEVTS